MKVAENAVCFATVLSHRRHWAEASAPGVESTVDDLGEAENDQQAAAKTPEDDPRCGTWLRVLEGWDVGYQ